MTIGDVFLGQINSTVFKTGKYHFSSFHINIFDREGEWLKEFHITGICSACFKEVHISTMHLDWDRLSPLVYGNVDPNCEGCKSFCQKWNPMIIANLVQDWVPGSEFPWEHVVNWPIKEDFTPCELSWFPEEGVHVPPWRSIE